MILLTFFGLLLNFIGVILLSIGFQIQKTDFEGFAINGKRAIVLKYENSLLRNIGWLLIIVGYLFQLIAIL